MGFCIMPSQWHMLSVKEKHVSVSDSLRAMQDQHAMTGLIILVPHAVAVGCRIA
jgi:hypothetical protein